MKWLLAALLLIAGLSPAQAALTLCNRTSYILYAATAVLQSPKSQAQGWTRIAPGDCQPARKEPLKAENTLVYARSGLAHSGPPRAWGGATPVCVKDTNFAIAQAMAQPGCSTSDSFALPFAPLGNRGQTAWTMNFDESPAMSLSEAQLAGVKRLLKDNGYRIGRIDGKPDRATGAALVDFRKRMKFADTAGNAELFAALEQQATRKIAPAGYTVCNDSREALLVALGQMESGMPVSRGWWTVQPGACARAVTTPLKGNAVYLLARQTGGGVLVGGTRKFCTTAAIFEIRGAQDCAGRGFSEQGFAVTPTKGVAGYVAHVGPAGLAH
jgi:uncharacterized membrane protein